MIVVVVHDDQDRSFVPETSIYHDVILRHRFQGECENGSVSVQARRFSAFFFLNAKHHVDAVGGEIRATRERLMR